MMYFARWKVIGIWAVIVFATLLCIPSFVPRASLGTVGEHLPWRQFQLGLDLKGGSYLLMEVDMEAVVRERLDNLLDSTRTRLRGANMNYTGLAARDRAVTLRLADPSRGPDAVRLLRELANPINTGGMGQSQPDLDVQATPEGLVTIALSEPLLRNKATQAVEQSMEIVRRRIDESGVVDPIIARQGANRLLVQLPGVQDPERIKQLIGKTARMTFHLLDENANLAAPAPPPGVQFLRGEGPQGEQRYAVRRRVEVDGANLTDARAGQSPQTGEWVVNFTFDSIGQRRFADITRANVSRPFAIVLDDRVITAPVIREPITGGRGQISGSFNARSANDLAVLLRAGALPAPLTVIEERTVGPDLGADAIRAGTIALAIGFVLVMVYMVAFYGLFGIFANVALVVNIVLLLAVLSLLEATLTLPGIAGILLTLGMAVDANILINERIREEAKRGRTPLNAMEAGFKRAFTTILDSNLTTVLAMAMLYAFGSGPVRGFAVTITIGIVVSMFSALVLVRLMMVTWYRSRRPAALPV